MTPTLRGMHLPAAWSMMEAWFSTSVAGLATAQRSSLSEPVSADRPVLETAQGLLKRLRRKRRVPARLLGVALSQLVREQAPVQVSMFDQPIAPATETEKDRAITHVVDDINAKFGRRGIRRGTEVGKPKPPRGRQD